MKEFKRTGVLLLSVLFAGFVLSSRAGDFVYTMNDGALTITDYIGPGGNVEIPAEIDGLPVTAIDYRVFYYNTALTTVMIPASITSLADTPFAGCSKLTAITIDSENPSYMSSDGVLFNKAQTTLMQCPQGKVGPYAIPSRVTSIGESAFGSCKKLTLVTIPSGAFFIGRRAFSYCGDLKAITIPASVTLIGDGAFMGCSSLTHITVDSANALYMSSDGVLFNKTQTSLMQCPSGKTGTYTIPSSVIVIESYAFYSCDELTEVTISSGVTSIGSHAFQSCRRLENMMIPSSVNSIGSWAFRVCASLMAITVDLENSVYMSADGVLFNQAQTTLIQWPGGKTGDYAIPDGVTSIDSVAFGYCTGPRDVTIPASVTSIGSYAFTSCTALERVCFFGDAPTLGSRVFNSTSATICRTPEATGWPTVPELWGDRPTALWTSADIDFDGLPNWWEQTYFGDATIANPSTICSNGINTLIEGYILGLNPTQSNERFEILDYATGVQDEFRWNAVSGRVYSVYWSTNLLDGFQCLETNIPWTQGVFTNMPSVANGYYKLDIKLAE